jgi:uncharacterized protein (TIGR03000 family)
MNRTVLKWTLLIALFAAGVTFAAEAARADVWYPVRPVAAWGVQPVYYATPVYSWGVYRPWRPVLHRVFHPFQRYWCGVALCCDPCCTVIDPCCTVIDPCCGGVVVEKSGTVKADAKKGEPTKAPEKKLTPVPGPAGEAPKSNRDSNINDARPAPSDKTATFSIEVPANAKVFINGYETRSTGARRTYVSHGLSEGNTYQYAVRVLIPHEGQASYQGALIERDGRRWIELTQDAAVQAGDRVQLAFSTEGRMNRYVKLASLPMAK